MKSLKPTQFYNNAIAMTFDVMFNDIYTPCKFQKILKNNK